MTKVNSGLNFHTFLNQFFSFLSYRMITKTCQPFLITRLKSYEAPSLRKRPRNGKCYHTVIPVRKVEALLKIIFDKCLTGPISSQIARL
ncbi:hypothetical protein BpHYR1_046234 [Brachionus plicatilis]|uniref:Uncharacterized protein n=1 Tax=Brachionus plicatilis TaxID=10195 RepID=A0A3M7T872_BRAPC|nr:hypothetical protein BpHYR1_046234 [Brachionus plicatilis]